MTTCATPRHVFVDLGVNWCNTIRLFEDVEVNKSAVTFTMQDNVFVKMDVEGSEWGILTTMMEHKTLTLIDTLSIECHHTKQHSTQQHACERLMQQLKIAAPKMRILTEGSAYKGYDSHSRLNRTQQADVAKACAAIDPQRFSLSRRPHGDV